MKMNGILRSALVCLVFAAGMGRSAQAQLPPPCPSAAAAPLAVDRGAAGVWSSLRKLHTRASLIMVVAHPDDEDGGLLAYEGRGQGVDTTLLTLTRGEGGQDVMASYFWDQLGLVRTEELLAAGNYYGVHQYFTRVADFGFSKTLDESLKIWGHDRVLYDAVRVVRMTRPLVVTSVFSGNISDGHGHHQVSGEMAQEVFNAAADPKMFPDQIAAGLLPWAPLKVYARVPFARVTDKGVYDYATGHWGPARFRNYVDGTWIEGVPSATVLVPEGEYNALYGESYLALARKGLSQQKSQNGGIGTPSVRPFDSPYHLYASRATSKLPEKEASFFDGIDTSLAAIADYAPTDMQKPWRERLTALNATVEEAIVRFDAADPAKTAPALAKGMAETNSLLADLEKSGLPAEAKHNMRHELMVKQEQFNDALGQALGLSLVANLMSGMAAGPMSPYSDLLTQATPQTIIPGESFSVDLHFADQGNQAVRVDEAQLVSHAGDGWGFATKAPMTGELPAGQARDEVVSATVPAAAELTRPYFTRPNIEQPYYDIRDPRYLNLPESPYPLTAEVAYSYQGVSAKLAGVVQSIHRMTGPGPVLEPLLLAPAISVTMSPEAGIVPLSNVALHLQVTVRSSVKETAAGQVRLQLPEGWRSEPETAQFSVAHDGDEQALSFRVVPTAVQAKPYTITAVADYGGQQYKQGFEMTGYAGLRPYPYYRDATYRTSGVNVKVAPGLKVGYIAGTGDDVARSLEDIGLNATFLTAEDIASADLSAYDTIVLGIRAYAARPELKTYSNRLLEYAKNGGVVLVQYQTPEYDHNYGPYPLSLSSNPEKVVEEDGAVNILAPNDPLFNWPNQITGEDFKGWLEERGHGFMDTWDPRYTALTEMHDAGQDPQKGGLLYTAYGKGAYVYVAYAFFRQMPDGVPGPFRIMANLISLGKNPNFHPQPAAAK